VLHQCPTRDNDPRRQSPRLPAHTLSSTRFTAPRLRDPLSSKRYSTRSGSRLRLEAITPDSKYDSDALADALTENQLSSTSAPSSPLSSIPNSPIPHRSLTLVSPTPSDNISLAPQSRSHLSSSSSDDSGDNRHLSIMPNNTIDPTFATVTSASPNKVPMLLAGELTIEVFIQWKDACEDYFEIKDIADEKRVTHTSTRFQNILVRDWFRGDAAHMHKLSWDDFASEFKQHWLLENWEQKSRNELTCARQPATEPFQTWIIKVETLNAVLNGTPSHKSDNQLRNHVESLMCNRLSQMATASNVTALNTYRDWKNKLITLDNKRLANVAEIARITGRGPTNTSSSSRSGFSSSSCNTPSTTNNNVRNRDHPPPLTD
jgi:hypothetical protein